LVYILSKQHIECDAIPFLEPPNFHLCVVYLAYVEDSSG